MQNIPEIWPPPPTTRQAEGASPGLPQPLNPPALLLGLFVGLIYFGGVWWAAYRYARSAGFSWQTQLPLGLAVPDSSSEFVSGLAVGSLLLLLQLVLLRRPLRDFSRGVAAGYLSFGLMLLFAALI